MCYHRLPQKALEDNRCFLLLATYYLRTESPCLFPKNLPLLKENSLEQNISILKENLTKQNETKIKPSQYDM